MAIYLDNHATTRLDPRVLEAMLPWLGDHCGNAGSLTHAFGREAREAVERAREQVAVAVGAVPREIIFTSGATESANLAILGSAERPGREGGRLVSWVSEHPAVLDPLEHLAAGGFDVSLLGVALQGADAVGQIDLDELRGACVDGTFLVSLLLANNEIGTIQPAAAAAEITHACGALLHLDAAQALGKTPIRVDELGADLMSLSAHKFHGPKGIGALFVRRRERVARLTPQVFGGGQERGLRSGTLNVPGIVGMGVAAELATTRLETDAAAMGTLRDRLWRRLCELVPDVHLNGPSLTTPGLRLPGNLNVRIGGVDGQTLLATLGEGDLAVSSGSACSSASPRPSHVLRALGLDDDQARASLRFGLSRFTTADEIDRAADLIAAAVARLRA
ncbi:MAG: cysteine desulfurase family protein [Pirellulales bacterium]|jgi:cysteine desulfurase